MAEKTANKASEAATNGQQGSHETRITPAEKIRQALGNLAAKL
jgi:hypothetical protein